MSRLIDPRRALLAAPLLAALLVAAYFLLLQDPGDTTIGDARLLETLRDSSTRVGVKPGNAAPDFELSTSDGRRLRLSELRGRPVMINFWATWCGSCLSEMPDIKALQQQKGVESFSVLAVNAGQTLDKAREFIDFLDAPFVYGLDPSLTVTDAYGVYGLPLSVFIDSAGIVRAVHNGHLLRERMEAYITAAIQARPAADFPEAIRLISTIPRERILYVTQREKGRVVVTSRSLRCDSTFCAAEVFRESRATQVSGVLRTASGDSKRDGSGEGSLEVTYDAAQVNEAAVIAWLVKVLEGNADPVYNGPVEVRYGQP